MSDTAADWQPIATAPKDGSWLWVGRLRRKDRSWVVTAMKWDESYGMWFAGSGWWHQVDDIFSHWKQLNDSEPAAPPEIIGLDNTYEL